MKLTFHPNTETPCPGTPAFISRWTMKRIKPKSFFGDTIGNITLWPTGKVTAFIFVGGDEADSSELQEIVEFMDEIKSQHRLALRADQVHRDLESIYEAKEGQGYETATGVDGTTRSDCGGVEVPDFTLQVGHAAN